MHFFRKILIALILVASLIRIDFWMADKAHQRVLQSAAGFDARIEKAKLNFEGPQKQGCEIKRVYVVNAYQTCFVGWYGEPGDGLAGFTFVYHRPQRLVLFYCQTALSRYFSHAEYGSRLKQVLRGGHVNHLHPEQAAS